ncbi:MAG: DUF4258 domain-containing protein [bacterium]
MKPIRFSNHARLRMSLRGASEKEVEETIGSAEWRKVKMGRFGVKFRFDFNEKSPINRKVYKYKTIEAVFADEPDEIVIITVKVYYSNTEA